MTSTLPLAGLRVLDITVARSGPTCVRHLADWGADVIAVRPPNGAGDLLGREPFEYENLHRNKRLITLDLKSDAGREAFRRLAKNADVVVENMRPDVKRRLGVAWEDLQPLNPRLVYGSISGFGQDGPYANRGGVDQIIQGLGGLMSVTGEPGRGPMRTGIAVSDMAAGTLLALAIMTALYEREKTGEGRYVHTSLLESQIFMLDFQASRWLVSGEVPGQAGNNHPTLAPMGVFPTADGHVNIAATSGRHFGQFCEVVGWTNWRDDPRLASSASRVKNRDALNAMIGEETRQRPSAWWVERLEAVGVPCGPILAVDEMFEDPQVAHLGMAAPVESETLGPTQVVASPLNFEGVEKRVRVAAPANARATDSVLAEVGYSPGEIAEMRRQGAI